MRILFTTHQGEIAGSTFSIIYLVKGLAAKGHEVHVACRRDVLLWTELSNCLNIHLHEVPFKNYLDLKSARKVAQISKRFQIDLVNAQSGRDRNLTIAAKILFGLKSKLVFTRRQRPRNEPWIKRFFHTVFTDRIVLVSFGLKGIFESKGYNENHLSVIHNGLPKDFILSRKISIEAINRLKSDLAIDGKIIACLSRSKYQDVIIQSLKYLPDDLTVLFIGISQIDLKESIQKSNPKQRLIFTGRVSHEEALEYLQLADVNILASQMDGFGLTLVESMFFGIPVLGSNFGGIPDVIVEGENGFLFENSDPSELAEKLVLLLSNEELRRKMVSKGLEVAESQFEITRVVNDYEELFLQLIDTKAAAFGT